MGVDLIVAYFLAASIPDIVNGVFESLGGFFIGLSIAKLHREKIVKGVSWLHVAFFSSWGFWNLYFYPHLDQWFSFVGGAILVTANAIWLLQIWYWNNFNKGRPQSIVEVSVERRYEPIKLYRHIDK
jgi:hypothetical protein